MTPDKPEAREVQIGDEQAGQTLAKTVRDLYGQSLSWNQARGLCDAGHVSVNGSLTRNSARRMRAGEMVQVTPRGQPKRRRGPSLEVPILHLDRDIVVVDKPAGLMSVPFSARDRDTLVDLTRAHLRKQDSRGHGELGIVQRLDKETSGVMLFARTVQAKRILQQQWRVHSIERRYWALCHGRPRNGTHDTQLIRDRGDGLRGSYGHFRRPKGPPPADAKRAVTHVEVKEALGPASRVECRLETGRQHQIRIHLSEDGHPLLGEAVYIRDFDGDKLPAPRLMLHARTLGLDHPRTGKRLVFTAEPPPDFARTLARLRESQR